MNSFFTLFLVTTLQSTSPGERPFIRYDEIATFDSRIKCEEERLLIMENYLLPDSGVVLACIKTDETWKNLLSHLRKANDNTSSRIIY